jgi:hypothetical protein
MSNWGLFRLTGSGLRLLPRILSAKRNIMRADCLHFPNPALRSPNSDLLFRCARFRQLLKVLTPNSTATYYRAHP